MLLVIVGWEHIMLFIKYLMHSLISPYPSSVINAMKKEEYQKTMKRQSSLRERNERRSNCHSSNRSTLLNRQSTTEFTDDEFSRTSDIGFRRKKPDNKYSKLSSRKIPAPADEKENSPLMTRYKEEELDPINHLVPKPTAVENTPKLRQRKGANSKKKQPRSKSAKKSNCPNPITPKRAPQRKFKTASQQKGNRQVTTQSPFGHYFHESNSNSPMIHHDVGHTGVDDDASLGGLLSVNSGGKHYDENIGSYNTNKPSMSRSKFARETLEEERAAQERIQKRISSVGERRRKKTERYMV